MDRRKLTVVLVQYDRTKYRGAIPRLVSLLGGLDTIDWTLIVVDNVHEGDWIHRVTNDFLHVGGDNRAWEFSAFDRGLAVADREGFESDAFLLVTDAFRAYGEEFLDLVDDRLVECCVRLRSVVGWMDSYMQDCRIGQHPFDTWIRTSFAFLAPEVLKFISPLAADLTPLRLFSDDSGQPFDPRADISLNMQSLMLEWLTTKQVVARQLPEKWHSSFDLDESTMPFFRSKVSSILREQLMSARLAAAGVPAYDLRCIARLDQRSLFDEFLATGGRSDLQWLGWRSALEPESQSELGRSGERWEIEASPRKRLPPGLQPLFLFAKAVESAEGVARVEHFSRSVLPLVRQRYRGARLLVLCPNLPAELCELFGDEIVVERTRLEDLVLPAECVAAVAPSQCAADLAEFLEQLADRRPLIVDGSISDELSGSGVYRAGSLVAFASICCQLTLESGGAGRALQHPD